MRLVLRGPAPAQKSRYRSGRRGRLYLDRGTAATIEGLILQARYQWRREPVEHPEVTVRFYGVHLAADRDGKLATILDVLQRAQVILNDEDRRKVRDSRRRVRDDVSA